MATHLVMDLALMELPARPVLLAALGALPGCPA